MPDKSDTRICCNCNKELLRCQIDTDSGLCEECYIEINGDVFGSDFEPYSPRCYDD